MRSPRERARWRSLVRRLSWAGHSVAEISAQTGLCLNTVKDIVWQSRMAERGFGAIPERTGRPLVELVPRPSSGPDILAAIQQMMPQRGDRDLREEIVASAALMILEGDPVEVAVCEATRKARREQNFTRFATRPIEGCFWL